MPDRKGIAVLAALVLAACGGESAELSTVPSSPSSAASPTAVAGQPAEAVDDVVDGERLVGALCDATAATTAAEAERAFMSGAHGPLHDLARQVVDVDRDVAARLHETKQQTEAALEDGDLEAIDRNVVALTAETQRSLATIGQPVGGCDERSTG
ncbi:MAG: hypothetical protein KY461_02135 [Actinobacteria bacterium]|nr:hypothetical protein [Actinomycetota bacterium]